MSKLPSIKGKMVNSNINLKKIYSFSYKFKLIKAQKIIAIILI